MLPRQTIWGRRIANGYGKDGYGKDGSYGKGEHYDDNAIEQLDHLETARLTQPAQRVEFGVDAFRFDFADPVRNHIHCWLQSDSYSL